MGLFIILVLLLWLTSPTSPWNNEGFENVVNRIVSGRYIRLEQKRVGCINLADIEAYSKHDGENIIKPDMIITKSSNYGNPDQYPAKNFIDGNTDTMLVTSCSDVGWILIDLGSVQPIYKIIVTNRKDCCRQRANGTILSILDATKTPVYIAHPMRDKKNQTTYKDDNSEHSNFTDYYNTFTYFPPYPIPFGDLSPSMTLDPPNTIDSVMGWASFNSLSNPTPMLTNETAETCRQMALQGGDKYVAWGYRKDNHPTDFYKNTCFLYHGDFKPFSGNMNDDIHLTGCIHPGQKVELGCKSPENEKTYRPFDKLKCRTLSTPFNDEGGGNAVYLDRHDVKCEPNELLGQFHLVREGKGRYRYNYTCCKVTSPPLPDQSLPTDILSAPAKVSAIQAEMKGMKEQLQKDPAKLIALEMEVKRMQEQIQKDPAKLAVLEAELKRLQEQNKADPQKLTALEAEVQRIQQQLQKSSSVGIPSSSPAPVESSVSSTPLLTKSASPPSRQDIIPQNTISKPGTDALVLGKQSNFLRDVQQAIRNEIYSDRATTPLF